MFCFIFILRSAAILSWSDFLMRRLVTTHTYTGDLYLYYESETKTATAKTLTVAKTNPVS